MNKFAFGSFVYEYKLIVHDRKTLSLTVKPDTRIILKVPKNASSEKIDDFLKRKWSWLESQLSQFRKYRRKKYKKEYVSGESFFYLGRQYELVVKRGSVDKVTLTRGKIVVTTKELVSESIHNKYLLKKWYGYRANEVFRAHLLKMAEKFKIVGVPELVIQKMSKRWGSFVNKRKIILNPLLIHASTDCIDYVIAHELCHFTVKKHNKAFYLLLEKKFPNWEKVKEKLESKYSTLQ